MPALFKKDRFDVEQEITELGNFSEMIKNYADMLYESEVTQTSDDVHTTLHGFANLLIAHSEKMCVTHKKVFELDEYAPTSMSIDEFYTEIEQERGNVQSGC